MHSPDMPRARSRADRSDPPRPRAQTPLARRGHAQFYKIGERGERARHTPIQLIVAEGAANPKRTRPLGGTTPHPRPRCAPTVPAHRTPSGGLPLEYSVVTSWARIPSESTATALLPQRPYSMLPTCIPRHAARSEQSRPIRPSTAAHAARRGHAQVSKIGERGERARHTPRQRVVAEAAARPERTRPLGGTTPHPQQRCVPTVPAHRTP